MREFVEMHILSHLGAAAKSSRASTAGAVGSSQSTIEGASRDDASSNNSCDRARRDAEGVSSSAAASKPTTTTSSSNDDLGKSQFSLAGLREHVAVSGDEELTDYFIVSGGNSPVTATAEEEEVERRDNSHTIPTMSSNFSVF
jgi:hypothetical protein